MQTNKMADLETVVAFSLLSLVLLIWLLFHRWSILGCLAGLLGTRLNFNDYVVSLLARCGNTADLQGPWFIRHVGLVTSDPENIHYILSSNASNFNKGAHLKTMARDVWGDGILAADSVSWKFQRRLIHKWFRQSEFSKLVENAACEKLANGMFPVLDRAAEFGTEVDLQDLFRRFATDLTCNFLFGVDLDSLSIDLPVVPLSDAVQDGKKVLFTRHVMPEFLWRLQKWMGIGVEGRATKANAVLDDFIYKQISLKRIQLHLRTQDEEDEDEDEDFDMISRFMMAGEEASSKTQTKEDQNTPTMPITDTFLRDSAMSILSAGKDTTSVTLTWFFWLISRHSSVQQKLQNELKEAFGLKDCEKWRFQSFQEIDKLVYLHATIYETLRLYPSLPYNHRASTKPAVLPSGHRVDKGTSIVISMYALGRMETIWGADCLEFRPERWISEKGEIIHVASNKFNAFSAGPRTCVGKDVALKELKIAISAIVWNYSFRVVEGHKIVPSNSTVQYIKHGLKVHVTKNSSALHV